MTPAALHKAAAKLRFVEGDPVCVTPRERAHLWAGIDTPDHWLLKLKSTGTFNKPWGIAMPGPTPTAFHPTETGGLLVRLERGTAEAALGAALALPRSGWKALRNHFHIHTWEKIVLFDGRGPGTKYAAIHPLPRGEYRLDVGRVDTAEAAAELVRLRFRASE